MQALLRTTHIETAAPAQRAGRASTRSCRQHQTKPHVALAAWPVAAPLEQYQDWSDLLVRAGFLSIDAEPLQSTCRGLRGSGLSHSRSARVLPLRLSRSGCVFPPGQTCTHSLRVAGSSRSHAHSLRNKPCFQHRAYALHFQAVLSSKSRFRPQQYGRRLQAWRYPIQIIRCPR